jgi:ribonuclease P protein subunit POP4
MITPENLVRHELIGLKAKVIGSTNKSALGLEGKVVDETRNTLVIEIDKKTKKLVKDQCVFSFNIPETNEWIKIDGKILLSRPEDRVKKKLAKW